MLRDQIYLQRLILVPLLSAVPLPRRPPRFLHQPKGLEPEKKK